ncbi:MAG: hypothetical protein VXX04_08330, partial [Actinomycetota bacterium]|nr:hypothetical protein [Actinomycetota bacterium]
MCPSELEPIVPLNGTAVPELDRTELIVVQSIPTTLSVLVWIALELRRRRRATVACVRRVARLLTLVASATTALLAWRVLEQLACEDHAPGIAWRVLGATGSVATGAFLAFAVVERAPRLAVLLALALASGSVVADVGLRGWLVSATPAALPLVAVQQLWDTIAVLLLLWLPARTSARAPMSTKKVPPIVVVDALSTRRPDAPPHNGDRSWSW